MTLKELLKSMGVTDEVISKVETGMKDNKIFTSGEENLDIRYGKLKTDHDSQTEELKKATALIAELKKGNAGNEDLQKKVAQFEADKADLEKKLEQVRLDSAIKVGLLSEKAIDVDYLTYKLKSEGELKLNDKGEIDGWKDKVDGLKKTYSSQFEKSAQKKIEKNKLPDSDGGEPHAMTKEEFLKKPYSERVAYHEENPDGYKALMEG